jgi:hypothetical protein
MDGLHIIGKGKPIRYGFIDVSGTEVIPPIYEYTMGFCKGLAAVELNGKWGFIDKTGATVIPFQYDDATNFWKDRDFWNNYRLLPDEDIARVKLNSKWFWINRNGKKMPAPLEFKITGTWYEDFLKMHVAQIQCENGLHGIVEEYTGKIIIPVIHKYQVYSFNEKYLIIRTEDYKYGMTDYSGNEIVSLKYDYLHIDGENSLYSILNGKYCYIDFNEKALTKQYDEFRLCGNGMTQVKLNGKYGFIDSDYREVIPIMYDAAHIFSEGLAGVKLNDKWGYIDTTGQVVIPFKYENARNFSEGFAAVYLNKRWKFIDKKGDVVLCLERGISIQYEYDFRDGYATVCDTDGGSWDIDKQGPLRESPWWPDRKA